MSNRLFTNYAASTLAAGITAGATSLTVASGHGARFPNPTSGKAFLPTLLVLPETATSAKEIIKVTARSGDTFTTIVRAQEGTSALAWAAGDTIELRWTADSAQKARYDDEPLGVMTQTFRGLHLRTHPDADKAASQIMLVHADAIVMDDGQEVLDWNRLVADLTASGAGGLDTGAEGADIAYEVYAIRRKSDDTRALLLHRAKDYFEDEISTAGEDGQHLLRDAATRTKLGQGFKVDTAGKLEFVDVKIAKIGAPTGNFWFTIESDSGGVPSGTVLATSDKYDVSRLPTTSLLVRLPFRNPFTTVAATQYHLVLQGDFAISATNHMLWRADTTAGVYANGSKAAFDGSVWTADTDDDFIFKIFVTRNDTAVTMPIGYDQRCLIGPLAYNNASSNFKRFWQHHRSYQPSLEQADWRVATGLGTTRQLLSLAGFVPARPVSAIVSLHNTATGIRGAFGALSATDVTQDNTTIPGQVHALSSLAAAVPDGHSSPLLVEFQAVMMQTGVDHTGIYVSQFEW